jgi:D-alanyl-D-alanine carboxypeptidase/D-alanyl-D-alanine-endopeptidase (penicillin-binding protein 4)
VAGGAARRQRWGAPGVALLAIAVLATPATPAAGRDTGSGFSPAASPAPAVLAAPSPASQPTTRPPGAPARTYGRMVGDRLRRPGAGTTSAAVVDLGTGKVVLDERAAVPGVPASTTKLLTAAAALHLLGPDRVFSTGVVLGRSAGELVLVGGGDPVLSAAAGKLDSGTARTPLPRLARRLAATLRAEPAATRPARVVVRPDDSLFARPAAVATWEQGYVGAGVAGPVGALALDGARRTPSGITRVADPGAAAAQVLARQLRAWGVPAVAGPRTRAARGAKPVAEVTSVPLGAVVEHMLAESDNDVAEVLARHVAVAAGSTPDGPGAARAIRTTLADLGVDLTGARVLDGSGLSRGARLSPSQLTRVLALAADPSHPELGAVLSGLPVAGLTGTLADRYTRPGLQAGLGLVRAKTGGLRGVSTLAGTTVGADGRTYAFAFVANGVPGSLDPSRRALDAAASALTTCGCR